MCSYSCVCMDGCVCARLGLSLLRYPVFCIHKVTAHIAEKPFSFRSTFLGHFSEMVKCFSVLWIASFMPLGSLWRSREVPRGSRFLTALQPPATDLQRLAAPFWGADEVHKSRAERRRPLVQNQPSCPFLHLPLEALSTGLSSRMPMTQWPCPRVLL